MEHKYLNSIWGKIHALIIYLSIMFFFITFSYDYSKGKTPFLWGLLISIIGFALFLKAKMSIIKKGHYFSFGCDKMDQKNTYFYFFGWCLIVAGYFLSWWK